MADMCMGKVFLSSNILFLLFVTAIAVAGVTHPDRAGVLVGGSHPLLRYRRDLRLLSGIYPGTKWCGKGNISSGVNDLGKLAQVDLCCMKHDNCPMSVNPGESKYGIANNGIYPISHCGCDDAFYSCLKTLSSDDDAQFIGEIYFDILRMKCFIKEHPKICIKWHWWGTCKKYQELRDQMPVIQVMTPRRY